MSERRKAAEDLKVVDRFWPALTESEVNAVFQHYPSTGNLQEIRWQSDRPLSAAGLVRTDRGLFFVKRHSRVVRNPEDLSFEHQLSAYLSRMGLDSPMVILTVTGADTLASPDWVYEVFTPAQGEDRYRSHHTWSRGIGAQEAQAIGRCLADMHDRLRECAIPPRKTRFQRVGWELAGAIDLRSTLEEDLQQRPQLAGFLTKQDISAIAEAFEPHLHQANQLVGHERLLCHGDPQGNNYFWNESEIACVIDYHLAGAQPPLAELACAIDRNGLHWLEILEGTDDAWSPDVVKGLINSYHTLRPLPKDSAEAFVALIALHRLDFAWSLLDYYITVERSELKASWTRDVFLQAHPNWLQKDASEPLRKFIYNTIEELP